MADSLALMLQSATLNQPRARFSGLSSDSAEVAMLQARLPGLADVREEAVKAIELLKGPPPTNVRGLGRDKEDLGVLHPAIAYHFIIPKLTLFSYFCREDDVPDDLQDLCVWALKQRLEAVREGPDSQLNAMLRDPATGRVESYAKTLMEFQTLNKLSNHLLSVRMNRPDEAVPYLEAALKVEEKLNPRAAKDPFSRNPQGYLGLGVALARTKSRDKEARVILERIINDIDEVSSPHSKPLFVEAKLYLSRVLRRMGELDEAKKLEIYLISWFKKNPNSGDAALRELFLTENADDPVFEGLGGMQWLENQKMTWKSMDRSSRCCFKCHLRESPSKKMLRCAKCQYTFYCSKECQREDYPSHKVPCKELVESRERAQRIKSISAEHGKRMEDWDKYKVYNFSQDAMAHALGLKHDSNRGLSHIIIRSAKYIPNGGKDVVDRFVIVAAGVFAINDIWAEIDSLMGYDPGESKTVIDEFIREFYDGIGRDGRRVINFDLLISDDKNLGAYLSTGSIPRTKLAEMNYNPHWRSLLNPGKNVTVEQLVLKCGVKDAEFDYYVDPQTATSQETLADLD